ncbi:ABC transporter substrate-binding protein [Streptomyces sp. F63]|uniref:ABC transporter substrate-binding protein n=1 Tax=Streptomyces sp. F63 TaxID=2824887 RepID=UPI001B38F029|nr:ABC transporter substrate-binding protein [Streptomyces sp. F63]MBQ0988300.1 ABC transporter substrate-binding protein [Streptomyces sp. F63]
MTGRLRSTPFLPRRAVTVAAATAVCASLLAGCGLAGASSATKDPVTVMTWAPEGTAATNMPGMPAMAKAYARWVNEKGGINGRELKVITCNEHNDTVSAGRCARRAVAEDVAAVVGSYSQHGRAFMSPLESEGIPYIGGYGVTDEEFTSPLSYPVNGGHATLIAGSGRQLAAHCERVTLVRPDTINGDQMPSLISAGLAEGDRERARDVRAPEDASQYTRQSEQALELLEVDNLGTEGACVTAALGDRTDTFFDSFRRLRQDSRQIRLASVLGSVQQSLVDRSGGPDSPFEGASITGWYPVADDPAWDTMRAVVREHAFSDNRVDVSDPGVQTTWIAYTVLHRLIESIGDGAVTGRSLRQALDSGIGADGIDTGGLTPELSWDYQGTLGAGDYPRIANTMVSFQEVRDGRLVAAREGFVNVGRTLERRYTYAQNEAATE